MNLIQTKVAYDVVTVLVDLIKKCLIPKREYRFF